MRDPQTETDNPNEPEALYPGSAIRTVRHCQALGHDDQASADYLNANGPEKLNGAEWTRHDVAVLAAIPRS